MTKTYLQRGAVAASAVLVAVLGWASFSWACGLYADAPTAVVSPNRATAASDVTVTGTGWQPGSAVSLSLSVDGSAVVQPLSSAAADSDGKFTARVRLGEAAAGVYYVSAVQGSVHTNIPLEVTALGGPLARDRWSQPSGSKAPSLTDLAKGKPAGSSFPWGIVLVAGSVLALGGGLASFEIRRQHAQS